ncbi:MAG: cell division protein ZapA [Deltaproteobacteria bacterium]|nr:MAG: cell division protein ZapA [Deltaproteobacteria bacterium]
MSQVHTITLLNQKLSLRSEHKEEHVQAISSFVNQKIQEVMDKLHNVSSLNAALMACLNMADELFQQKEVDAQMREKVSKIIEKIEHHLTNE